MTKLYYLLISLALYIILPSLYILPGDISSCIYNIASIILPADISSCMYNIAIIIDLAHINVTESMDLTQQHLHEFIHACNVEGEI